MQAVKELHKIEITLAKLYSNMPDVLSDNNNDFLSPLEFQQSTIVSNNEEF